MISDIFLNPKKYNKDERRDKIKELSINNVILKNNFNGYNYSYFNKNELFDKKNISIYYNYIKNIKNPIYEVLSYDIPTKFYLDCEMEDIPQNILEKKDEIILKFNTYLLKFLNKKFQNNKIEVLYADASRFKTENNYKLSLHVIVNKLGYFCDRSYLKKVILEFIEELPKDIFFRNGKNFVDSEVYHRSQLIRIIYSSNKHNNSILKPFIIENNKLIYKNIEYISNNYYNSLCGNYNNKYLCLDPEKNTNTNINSDNNILNTYNIIPQWKLNWIKNNNYIKNIFLIDGIEKNKVHLKRINFNAYCKLCKRNHEKENAMCKVYKNNIIFYCNRYKNGGVSIGSWYNEFNTIETNKDTDNEILSLLKIENKKLKEKISKLENEIIILKNQKCNNINYNLEINSKWYKYYDCGKILINNGLSSFKNIIGQIWDESNISKLKNRCLRIYNLIEFMKENNIKNVKCTIRKIFHLQNWDFDHHLKNKLFF